MNYDNMPLSELQDEAKRRGISHMGNTNQLRARLRMDDDKEGFMYERSWQKVLVLVAAVLLLLLCGLAVTKTIPALMRGAGKVVGFFQQPAVAATSELKAQTTAVVSTEAQQPQLAEADLTEVNSQELTFCQEWGMGVIPSSPLEKWNETFDPKGDLVENSCVLREADSSNPRGWGPATIPSGVVAHLWLDKNGSKLAVTIVGPANVEAPYLISRATFYIGENPFLGHEGQWTFDVWPDNQTPVCPWVNVGEDVIVCDTQAMATATPAPSASTPSATPAPATAPATTIVCPLFDGVQSELRTEGGATYCKIPPKENALNGTVPKGWILDWSFKDQHGRAAAGEKVTLNEGTFWSVQ